MGFEAQIVCDSIASGVRLTTMVVTFPRIILAEFNTHRMFSRNSASSRAIPVERRMEQVYADPFVPEVFAANRPGMQAGDILGENVESLSREKWYTACRHALAAAKGLCDLGVHKQWANRLLEPFAWHTVVVSATEWDNFWALRCHPDAQPEMQTIARLMRDAYRSSTPRECQPGDYHLPFVNPDEGLEGHAAAQVSIARAAAVSYERHLAHDIDADVKRYERLLSSGHMSPFEHVARVSKRDRRAGGNPFFGNFRLPWVQHRKMLPGEAVFSGGAA